MPIPRILKSLQLALEQADRAGQFSNAESHLTANPREPFVLSIRVSLYNKSDAKVNKSPFSRC